MAYGVGYTGWAKNWLAVDKVIAKITRLTFLAHPVHVDGGGG